MRSLLRVHSKDRSKTVQRFRGGKVVADSQSTAPLRSGLSTCPLLLINGARTKRGGARLTVGTGEDGAAVENALGSGTATNVSCAQKGSTHAARRLLLLTGMPSRVNLLTRLVMSPTQAGGDRVWDAWAAWAASRSWTRRLRETGDLSRCQLATPPGATYRSTEDWRRRADMADERPEWSRGETP